jgi:hypothetical protein
MIEQTGADYPLTWMTENAVIDWSGISAVIVCRHCGEQFGPQWTTQDALAEASSHRRRKHPDARPQPVPRTCADCGRTARLARNVCESCRNKRRKAWLVEHGLMDETDALYGYLGNERADRRAFTPCQIQGCVSQCITPNTLCERHRRAADKAARQADRRTRQCIEPGCTTVPHPPNTRCAMHRQKEAA